MLVGYTPEQDTLSLTLVGYTPEQDTLSGQLVNIESIKVDDERETRVGSFMS